MLLAPMSELREFTGRRQPAAVARHLRALFGLAYIEVNSAGLVTMPNDAWERIREGRHQLQPAAIDKQPEPSNNWQIRIPSAKRP